MGKIADILALDFIPVAIYRTDRIPEDASVPTDHCSIPPLLVNCARSGKKWSADKEHVYCHGAISGFGFGGMGSRQRSAWKISCIPPEHQHEMSHGGKGEFKNPEIAMIHLDAIKDYGDGKDAIVFQALDEAIAENRPIEVVVFLADPTRISALSLLAGYSKSTPGPSTVMPYGHACQQVYALPRAEGETDDPHAVLGMTDLYARRFVPPEIMSFSVPYKLYQRMDSDVEESFLGREKWAETLKKCI
ncbi:MAG: DUF169 domain-containing protein [archaeon]|nr:DUF169 domain-containing protein [archaeon]